IERNVVLHFAVWSFEESVFVHSSESSQVNNETDVWTFGSGNRTDASVVTCVHVTNVEARALAAKTSRTHRGETTLVRKLSKRVGLIHELGKLRGCEEFAHCSRNWTT